MLVNKFMAGNETVATQAVLDQFYKDPGLPAPASTDVIARAIQLESVAPPDNAMALLLGSLDGQIPGL